jgi:hypothetical protein
VRVVWGAYGAGWTLRAWLAVLCVGAGPSLVKLRERRCKEDKRNIMKVKLDALLVHR